MYDIFPHSFALFCMMYISVTIIIFCISTIGSRDTTYEWISIHNRSHNNYVSNTHCNHLFKAWFILSHKFVLKFRNNRHKNGIFTTWLKIKWLILIFVIIFILEIRMKIYFELFFMLSISNQTKLNRIYQILLFTFTFIITIALSLHMLSFLSPNIKINTVPAHFIAAWILMNLSVCVRFCCGRSVHFHANSMIKYDITMERGKYLRHVYIECNDYTFVLYQKQRPNQMPLTMDDISVSTTIFKKSSKFICRIRIASIFSVRT